MNTLDYILRKFAHRLDASNPDRMPIELPNFGREGLAELFHELGFLTGVEIGVQRGMYAEQLCRANPQAVVYGVDPWREHIGYRPEVAQREYDSWLAQTQERMATYHNHVIIQKTSLEAVRTFAIESIDWVYIDGNHELMYAIEDLTEWSARVRPGGIVSGHDYAQMAHFPTRNHVYLAVNAYTAAYHIRPWFVLGRREAASGEVRDDPRSWMWVRP